MPARRQAVALACRQAVEGRERACIEGCKGNTECSLEIISNERNGLGGFTIVFGRGFADADLEDLPGDILVVGPCAVGERAFCVSPSYRTGDGRFRSLAQIRAADCR